MFSKDQIYLGNEGFLQSIFNKLRGVPSKSECIFEYKNIESEIKSLLNQYKELTKEFKFEEKNQNKFDSFCNEKGKTEKISLGYFYIEVSKDNKQEAIKYDNLCRNFVNKLTTKIKDTKKFGLYVLCDFYVEGKYYIINYSIYLAKKCFTSIYVPTNSASLFIEEDKQKIRKNMVDLYKNSYKATLEKYKDISKGFSLAEDDISNDILNFIEGRSNEVFIHFWSIWEVTDNARDEQEYEKYSTRFSQFLKDLEINFNKNRDTNFYISYDSDWDESFIGISTKTSKNKKGNESLDIVDLFDNDSTSLPLVRKMRTIDVDFGSEGILPTFLDRDYLESDDPNMKRKIMNDIGILTRKMVQRKVHFYLNPQIDDELVYQYLRYFPEELSLLNKWIRIPNFNLLPRLYKAADKLQKMTSFNKDTVPLYRGFWHSNTKSIANQKYPQQRMGLSEIETEGSIPKKSGSRFKYPLLKPISFTRSKHIANKFGTIVIKGSLKGSPHKFIDDNDSLIAAVFINNGSFMIPKFYDHIRFLKEVIVLPDPDNTLMNFSITQTPVPLYFAPYDPKNSSAGTGMQNNKNFGVMGSLYNQVFKLMGNESLSEDNVNSYSSELGLYTNIEEINSGNEELFSSSNTPEIKVLDIAKKHKEFLKFSNKYLEELKNLRVSNTDFLMVAKTNSTNDIFQARLVKRALVLIKEVLDVYDTLIMKNGLSEKEIIVYTKKLENIIKDLGFTNPSNVSQISKEIEAKCTHGRVFELGYNLPTVTYILRNLDNLPVEKIASDISKVKIDSKILTDKLKVLFTIIFSGCKIINMVYDSLFNILKRTYSPLKEYIQNKQDEKNKVDKAEESFSISKENELEILYNQSIALYIQISKTNFDIIGNEGLTNFVTRALANILNVLLRLLNNVKAMIVRPIASLQRTELHKFVDDHRVTVNRILSVKYTVLSDMQVPCPIGMIKPYKVTSEAIKNSLDLMDMKNRMTEAYNSVNYIAESLINGSPVTLRNNSINLGEVKAFEDIYKKSVSCFNPSARNEDKPFTTVFPSDHCLKDTYSVLDDAVDHEYDIAKIYSTLEKLYKLYETILNLVEKDGANITKNDLLVLSEQTTTLAKMFDMYGVTINDLQRVEHNFVLVMYAIQKQFDL